jgi:hypothetical protein
MTSTIEANGLTKIESAELARHEKTIGDGLTSFVDVGNALAAIRDGSLHRQTHERFDDYLKDKWSLSRTHAYRLIDAADVATNSPVGNEIVHEGLARVLARVPKKQHRKVMREAKKISGGDVPTAAELQRAADQTSPKGDTKSSNTYAKSDKDAPEKDEDNSEPKEPWTDFNNQVQEVMSELRSAARKLGRLFGADGAGKRLSESHAHFYSYSGTIGGINAVVKSLADNMPAAPDKKPPGFIPARVKAMRESR